VILKTIVCDGPTCETAIRVPLEAPLRDLLPDGWYALVIPPEESDAHFCSALCMHEWSGRRLADVEPTTGTGHLDMAGEWVPEVEAPARARKSRA